MPRGRTASPLSRRQRLDKAYGMFAKGYRTVDVMRALKISEDTARRYRRAYEAHLQEEVSENPRMLTDVLGNTVRLIEEIDLVKKDAWKRLDRKSSRDHFCPECECHIPMLTSEATSLHKVILDTTQQRMRLFGLLGVKQEYFIHVQRVQLVQQKVIEFLQTELCEEDRLKFENFMLAELPSGVGEAPVIDATATESLAS